ncbi:cytochrome c biogenesis protein ResB [Rarobacter faecitabidus]|uniref:Cytochrome c biogenesis protein n=1 Tax=Rarobacter faecitabidus TaxID=13243 RepID=A0A542ZTU9_RARFA|nr:cytochrome c biogenesis protein ResB [Rarobacter faecitabidus]TQL63783.1 cytochrome c biogenesis protein [Rarobacter faecitabidus]
MSESTVVAGLGWRGWLRFIWRQLTSMRVALMLLMLLAVAAIPGSIIPQRMANPTGYQRYLQDHPDRVDLLNRLQLFDVYTSVWFSAIYLLLFISLIGCIIPRIRVHARALRQAPPRAPRNFERMPVHVASAGVSVDVDEASARALRFLRRPRLTGRFRTAISNQEGAIVVGGESGYLRETGNLLFHVALVGILISVALGQLFHYRGQVILVQGKGFANAQVDYDTFESGAWFDPASMSSFNMTLDDFDAQFRTSDAQAQDFTAHVTITRDGAPAQKQIKVNHPLNIDGAKIYLQGNGYAPEVSVTDADGNVAFAGAIPFISRDSVYTSQGTIKVPDVTSGEQFGLVGYLLPTADQTESGAWRSLFPELLDPALVLTVWRGDLGLDDGIPQNVYQLDTASMTQSLDGANPVTLVVRPGQTVDLPDGLGQFTFEGVKRFVALDLRHDPSLTYVLVSALAAVAGLGLSLFIPRRRMWVRITADSIEAAGISRTDDGGLERAVRSLAEAAAPLAPDSADPKQPKNSNLEGQ